jgi:hypothetical protein
MLKEPIFQSLPTEEDFYYDGDCDERYTIKEYLGKDIEYTKERYYHLCGISVLHDFYFVGTKAARYYLFGAFRYLQEDKKDEYEWSEAQEVYSALPNVLLKHLEENSKDMAYIADYLMRFCQWAIDNYEKFNVDEEIYGDTRREYMELLDKIKVIYGRD